MTLISPTKMLTDNYGRRVSYLRISVTDRCNFHCCYCNPGEETQLLPHEEILTYTEIMEVVKTAVGLGITKFRITGGEPLTRPGITDFLGILRRTPGVEWASLTTNGSLLARYYQDLKRIGLDGINVSLNSLDETTFERMTGVRAFRQVWAGLETLWTAGVDNVKINTVIMRGINDGEIFGLAALTITRPIVLRFIEYMPCGLTEPGGVATESPDATSGGGNWGQEKGASRLTIPADEVMSMINNGLGQLMPVDAPPGNGPARYYQLPGAQGLIGFITPISRPFCTNCNRLRLTAEGKLKHCLLSEGSVDIKHIIRQRQDKNITEKQLVQSFQQAISRKPAVHHSQRLMAMSQIGG